MHKNYELALDKLREFIEGYDGSEVQRAGIIQAFEFTYEQAWRMLQKHAGQSGLNVASPKKAFEYALQAGFIQSQEEALWVRMIEHRNLTTHTYKSDLAMEIYKTIAAAYLPAFGRLLERMKVG